jgi:hypothetical protein
MDLAVIKMLVSSTETFEENVQTESNTYSGKMNLWTYSLLKN